MKMQKQKSAPGFTLTELLVVIAITIILMGLLLGPLAQTFNMTSRGRTMIAAQDNARGALAQISKELQDAMFVYDDLPLNLWHYNAYEFDPNDDPVRPWPAANALPTPHPVSGGMIDLVLPRMRFYCIGFNHFLNVVETASDGSQIDTRRIAIDTCPRAGHAGSPVEQRPTDPLQPEEVRVRYFIGLLQPTVDQTDPGALPGSASDRVNPHYANGFLFKNTALASDNLYVLYRVEFNPNITLPGGQPNLAAAPTANWLLNRDVNYGGRVFRAGTPNPNFCYDTAFAPEWKSRAVAIVTSQDTDLVRLVRTATNTWLPEPTVRFTSTPIVNETLNANSTTGTLEAAGIEGAPRPPTQYAGDYGNWSGPNSDASLPLTESVVMAPQRPANPAFLPRYLVGPRIQVFEQSRDASGLGDRLDLVYDSALPSSVEPRQRLFTWDSRRGLVNFALRRIQFPPPANGDPETFFAAVLPDYTTDLKADMASAQVTSFTGIPEVVPTGFGALKQHALLGRTVRIVPGSETITRISDRMGGRSVLMERAGYTGLGLAGGDQFVAQADLQPSQYTIDYSTGVITFSDKDPSLLEARMGGSQDLVIRYQFQTNRSTDVVRASYSTRELMTVQLGLVQFEPRSGDAQSLQLTNRVRVRNVGR
jgi:type II secretory pathway pseudopilin PulG